MALLHELFCIAHLSITISNIICTRNKDSTVYSKWREYFQTVATLGVAGRPHSAQQNG